MYLVSSRFKIIKQDVPSWHNTLIHITQSYYDIVYNNNVLSMSSIYSLLLFLSTNLEHHLKVVRADNGSHLQNVKSFRIVGPRLRAASVCVVLRFRSCIRSCHSLYHWSWSSEIKLPGNLKLRDQRKLLEPLHFGRFRDKNIFKSRNWR